MKSTRIRRTQNKKKSKHQDVPRKISEQGTSMKLLRKNEKFINKI